MTRSVRPTAAGALLRGLAVAMTLAGASCSRGTTPAEPAAAQRATDARQLVGTWDLVQGCGGIAFQCRTPDALIEPTRYVFRADGIVEAYRDGTLRFTTNYQLLPPRAGDPDARSVLLIGLGPAVDPRPLYVSFRNADSLVLDEGCCDRFAFEYRRAQ